MRLLQAFYRRFAVRFVQSLFFFGIKVRPKLTWVERFHSLGTVERSFVHRDAGSICCLRVRNRDGGDARGVAILAHPVSRKAKYFFSDGGRINTYLDNHYDVIVFDFNGFGESDRIDLSYWKDANAVINDSKLFYEHVILHGVSFGSFHVIPAIPALPAGAGVVLENTSRSLYDYWKRWALTRNAVKVLSWLSVPAVKEMDVGAVLGHLDRPDLEMLFIACGNDNFTPAEEMHDLASRYSHPSRFVVFPEAPHLGALEADRDKYVNLIKSMLK
jgi:pimeloyl-ACP methyl ester carboxylesterase